MTGRWLAGVAVILIGLFTLGVLPYRFLKHGEKLNVGWFLAALACVVLGVFLLGELDISTLKNLLDLKELLSE